MSDSRKVLFYARSPMNTIMIRPVVRALALDPRIRLFLYCDKPSNPDDSPEVVFAPLAGPDGALPGKPIGALRGSLSRFDLLVSPDVRMPVRHAGRRVQVFHGVSFKGKAYSEKMKVYSDLFVIGEYMRRRFVSLGLYEDGDAALHPVGMPKTDALVDGSVDRRRVLGALGVEPDRRVVIYAPTWRKESSLNREGEAIVDALADMGLTVLVKIHDHCRDPRTNRRDWGRWLDAREDDRVRRVRDADIVPYLVASDLLVSDASSVANEFALLDRPILFMDVPELLDVYRQSADLDTWGRSTGDIVRGAGDIRGAVERALSDPMRLSERRRAAAADLFYHPGRATRAAVEMLYDIMDMAPMPLPDEALGHAEGDDDA